MKQTLEIFSDGGARGNPGPGACAFVIKQKGTVIHQGSKYLGRVTNNFAEYQGVILALNFLVNDPFPDLGEIQIVFYLDSELVVNQLNGIYKIKNPVLKKLNVLIKEILNKKSIDIVFKSIPRIKNKTADFLVNQELDKNSAL